MSPRSRRALRALTILGFLGALAAVALAYRGRFGNEPPPAIGKVEGWAARGVRYNHEGRGGTRLRITATAIRPVPIRWGMFRIGFADRFEASDLDVAIDMGAASDLTELERDFRDALTSMARSQSQGKRLAGGRIRGLSVRLRRPDLPALEIRAERCELAGLGSRQIVCRGDVVAVVATTSLPFQALAYDVVGRTFEVPDDRDAGAVGEVPVAARERTEVLNAAFRQLMQLP